VLDFFGVSVPVLQIAGGLVVASLGVRLLHDSGTDPEPRRDKLERARC
jgi:small neutral amino acid transporter SnatA (MarC family)